jgi:hypothetical protein
MLLPMSAKSFDPSDPALDAECLSRLAKSRCRATKRAVAMNPNTPLEVLRRLWMREPDCLLENPILTLWEVSSPDDIHDLIGLPVFLELFNAIRGRGETLPEWIFNRRRLGLMASEALDTSNKSVFKILPLDTDSALRMVFINAVQPNPRCRFFFDHAPEEVWKSLARDSCEEVAIKFAKLLAKYKPAAGEMIRPAFVEASLALAGRKNPRILQKLARSLSLPGK